MQKSIKVTRKERSNVPEPKNDTPRSKSTNTSSRSSISEKGSTTPSFLEIQLKPSETRKISWTEPKLEVVKLKSHEFEKKPFIEELEKDTNIQLTKAIPELRKVSCT